MQGLVRNLSAGGLSLQLEREVDQGDTIRVAVESGPRAVIEIETIVWHSRRVRDRRTRQQTSILGLVLSMAGEDYLDLLESVQPASRPEPQSEPEAPGRRQSSTLDTSPESVLAAAAEPDPEPPELPALPRPLRYRIRVTKRGSPRTRSVVAFATDPEEAARTALSEVGDGWDVLEVEIG